MRSLSERVQLTSLRQDYCEVVATSHLDRLILLTELCYASYRHPLGGPARIRFVLLTDVEVALLHSNLAFALSPTSEQLATSSHDR